MLNIVPPRYMVERAKTNRVEKAQRAQTAWDVCLVEGR
jgi:hypothetical protein